MFAHVVLSLALVNSIFAFSNSESESLNSTLAVSHLNSLHCNLFFQIEFIVIDEQIS